MGFLDHWHVRQHFTLTEVAALACGVEPDWVPVVEQDRVSVILEQLVNAYRSSADIVGSGILWGSGAQDLVRDADSVVNPRALRSLDLMRCIQNILADRQVCSAKEYDEFLRKLLDSDLQYFDGNEIARWFRDNGNGFVSKFDFSHGSTPSAGSPSGGKWPWGTYETNHLRQLAAAVERFWVRYDPEDPSTAPTNEQVASWLIERQVSKRTADVIAGILRADGLPMGRRPKE